ncbi:MAG: simple sugar transport system permease protein, partial [Pseudonocardia sp.]
MSSPVATPPSPPSTSAKGTEPVRVQRSLGARILARPEIGALAAAIAIFVFFFAIAPPFRTPEALST